MALTGSRGSRGGSGVRLSQTSPTFLHANSTSHTWPFSAIAELIDNAYDPDVSASQLYIDVEDKYGKKCLVFMDNGNGMTPEKLHKMLSFGYCEKVEVNGHKPVGCYGNGFKSGSMRLGKDAIVFTKVKHGTMSIGFLSQTYLSNIGASTVLIPMVAWDVRTKKMAVDDCSKDSIAAITQHSIFTSEKALLQEMTELDLYQSGTRIVIYNLKRFADGMIELDFQSKSNDILNSERQEFDFTMTQRPIKEHVPEYRRSLREYCSILFLKPRMKIILRDKKVKTKLISKSLSKTEKDCYKPRYLDKPVKMIFGFSNSKEDYGLMMYHSNRLIKAYERIGCQKQANELGVGVVSVVEVDFLEPIHNKQDFNKTDRYNAFISAAAIKLKDYWIAKTNSGILSEQRCKADCTWVQCDNCLKWRRLPDGFTDEGLPDKWFCYMNPDSTHTQCDIVEECEDEDEFQVRRSYDKVNKKKSSSGKHNQGNASDLETTQMNFEIATQREMEQRNHIKRLQENRKEIELRLNQVQNNINEQYSHTNVLDRIAKFGEQPQMKVQNDKNKILIPVRSDNVATTHNEPHTSVNCKQEKVVTFIQNGSIVTKTLQGKKRRYHNGDSVILIESDDKNCCTIVSDTKSAKKSDSSVNETHYQKKTEQTPGKTLQTVSISSHRTSPDNNVTGCIADVRTLIRPKCADKQTQASPDLIGGDNAKAQSSDDTSGVCFKCGSTDTKDNVKLLQVRLEETTSKLTGLRNNVRKLLQTILTDIKIENLEFIDPIVSEMVRVNDEEDSNK